MKILSEIQKILDYKFKKYFIVNFWENDNTYYLCVYSGKAFYFCRGRVNQAYPCNSVFIEIDKVVTLAEIKKSAKELKV